MRAFWLAAGITAAATLAGCGAPAEEETTTTTTSVAPAGHGSLAHCLSEHGVPAAPGPAAAPPPGVDPGTWQQAMQACASLAPGPAGG